MTRYSDSGMIDHSRNNYEFEQLHLQSTTRIRNYTKVREVNTAGVAMEVPAIDSTSQVSVVVVPEALAEIVE